MPTKRLAWNFRAKSERGEQSSRFFFKQFGNRRYQTELCRGRAPIVGLFKFRIVG